MTPQLDRQTVRRLALVTGFAATFLVVGSLNRPQPTLAGAEDAQLRSTLHFSDAEAVLEATVTGPRLLGTIAGNAYVLEAYSGPEEPLYTLRRVDGTLLATGLTAAELLAAHPEKPELQSLVAGLSEGDGEAGEALMLAPAER
jgi:hypothetical protein